MRKSTNEILGAFKEAGLITEWSRKREQEWRGFTETIYRAKSEHVSLGWEIFGKDAQLFISPATTIDADWAKEILRTLGYEDFNDGWMGRETPHFSIDVRYFKGERWWE